MEIRPVLERIPTVVVLAVLLFSSSVLALSLFGSEALLVPFTHSNSTVSSEQKGQPLGLPVRLTIPRISVDASIEHVGVTAEGAMAAPKSRSDVAWFKPGVRPGEIGSAVIAGHYGWKNLLPSAFDKLYTLVTGDTIYVRDDAGIVTTFVVREIKNYDEQADTTEVFISKDGKKHLNLITCEGVWNATKKSYSGRLVVFADAINK